MRVVWAVSAQVGADLCLSNKEQIPGWEGKGHWCSRTKEVTESYTGLYSRENREFRETENSCLKSIKTQQYQHMLPSPTEHRTLAACFWGSLLAAMGAEASSAFKSKASEVLYSQWLVTSLKAKDMKVKHVFRFTSIQSKDLTLLPLDHESNLSPSLKTQTNCTASSLHSSNLFLF